MIIRDKELTGWQTGILMFILLFANKILVLPSLMFEGAKLEAYFVPIILSVLEMGLVLLFYFVKTRFPDKSFAEILQEFCGNWVKNCTYVLFAVFFIAKAVLLYNVTYVFFKTIIYREVDNFLCLFCFIPVMNYRAISGLGAMGRTAQLFFPVIISITVFCIVIGLLGINSTPLFFEASAGQVFLTALRHISAFGDTLFLFVIMDKAKINKKDWKVVFSLSALALLFVIAITAIFLFSYTNTSFMHPFALFEIMSYVKEYGGVGRIDIISMVVILIFTYFHLGIYLKGFLLAFDGVFGINPIYGVVTFNLAFWFLIRFVVLNLENAVVYGETVLPFLSVISFVLVPVLVFVLWIVRRRRGRRKE